MCDQLHNHPPLRGGERRIVNSLPFRAASKTGELPVLMPKEGCVVEHKSPCWMKRFVRKEQLRLVPKGCREPPEGEAGGPFHVPISVFP